jgi:hypothetical protein
MTEAEKMPCESCGMPIEAGPYCHHCVGDDGKLQPFDERFERVVQWQMRHRPALDRGTAEKETLQYMAKMPAWKNHPRIKARS